MLPAHSIVIYPLTLEAVLKTDPTANRIYLLRKSMQDQPNKPRWICYSTHFLEEEFYCVLKLTFLTLLSAESKQITCQSCPMLKVYRQLFFNLAAQPLLALCSGFLLSWWCSPCSSIYFQHLLFWLVSPYYLLFGINIASLSGLSDIFVACLCVRNLGVSLRQPDLQESIH